MKFAFRNQESGHKIIGLQTARKNVGSYAERDAEATYGLWQEMKKEIIAQDLQSIMELETDLFPCLVDMRFKGVRVDVERAHSLKKQLINII